MAPLAPGPSPDSGIPSSNPTICSQRHRVGSHFLAVSFSALNRCLRCPAGPWPFQSHDQVAYRVTRRDFRVRKPREGRSTRSSRAPRAPGSVCSTGIRMPGARRATSTHSTPEHVARRPVNPRMPVEAPHYHVGRSPLIVVSTGTQRRPPRTSRIGSDGCG